MKRVIGLIALLLLGLASTDYAKGEITVISCTGNSQEGHDLFKQTVYAKNPNNVHVIYAIAFSALCLGKREEGIPFLKRASDGGHSEASFLMAKYYETDKTLDNSQKTTKDPENFNAALFYYERAAKQIESNPHYPEDNDRRSSIPDGEANNHYSARVFTQILTVYVNGYRNALIDIINSVERTQYVDTLEVLKKIGRSAERCLERPSLSIWKRSGVYRAMQVRCQASLDFVEQVYTLEQERIEIAKDCSVPVKECSEHKDIVVKKIAPLLRKRVEKVNSVSL